MANSNDQKSEAGRILSALDSMAKQIVSSPTNKYICRRRRVDPVSKERPNGQSRFRNLERRISLLRSLRPNDRLTNRADIGFLIAVLVRTG